MKINRQRLLTGILVLTLFASMGAIDVCPVYADDRVMILGHGLKDYTMVNGTLVVSFSLRSQEPISSVVCMYYHQNETWVNVTMSLVEGNQTAGWWEATTIPRVWATRMNESTTRRHINPMKLFVSLPSATIEMLLPQDYASLATTQIIRKEKRILIIPLGAYSRILSFLPISGAVLVFVVVFIWWWTHR